MRPADAARIRNVELAQQAIAVRTDERQHRARHGHQLQSDSGHEKKSAQRERPAWPPALTAASQSPDADDGSTGKERPVRPWIYRSKGEDAPGNREDRC